jgi:hypothetical protein
MEDPGCGPWEKRQTIMDKLSDKSLDKVAAQPHLTFANPINSARLLQLYS